MIDLWIAVWLEALYQSCIVADAVLWDTPVARKLFILQVIARLDAKIARDFGMWPSATTNREVH